MNRERAAALAAFEATLRRRNLVRSTRRDYVAGVRGFLEHLPKNVRLVEVERDHVRRFLGRRPRESARHDLTALRMFFADLLCEGADLPTDGLRAGRPRTRPPLLLCASGVSALMAVASDTSWRAAWRTAPAFALRDRALIELLFGAGLRCAELVAAKLLDLELTEGTLLVRRAKRGPSRVVPMPPAALPHLRRYVRDGRPHLLRDGAEDDGALLLSLRGTPLSRDGVYGIVTGLARRAGVRAHPHALRRAVATGLVRGGASVLAVKELLGHSDLSTTAAYVSLDVEDLRRAVAHLDREP